MNGNQENGWGLKNILISSSISFVMIVFTLLKLFAANAQFDNTVVAMLVLGVTPWVLPLIKSIRLPGGTEIALWEIIDRESITEQANNFEIFNEEIEIQALKPRYSFWDIASTNPKMAIASLAIEIEDRLRSMGTRVKDAMVEAELKDVLLVLWKSKKLRYEEISFIEEVMVVFASAMDSKSAKFEYCSVNWALQIGARILNCLDKRAAGEDCRVN